MKSPRFWSRVFVYDMMSTKMSERKIILLVAGVILASFAYSLYYRAVPASDAQAYNLIAQNLVSGRGYVEDSQNSLTPEKDEAIIRVGPGYQFFLAIIYALFGQHLWIVWLMHAILRGMSAFLLHRLSLIISPGHKTAALVAAGIFGFWPDLIVVNGLLLTETLFLFLLISASYVSAKLLRETSWIRSIVAGVLWGVAILTRPTALFPLAIIAGLLAWKSAYKQVLVLTVVAGLCVAPWSIFVTKRFGSFILTTTVGGYDLWVGNNPDARGGFEKIPEIQEARARYHSVELDKIGKKKYFKFLVSDPLAFTELQIRKTALYFSLLRPTGFWFHLGDRPLERAVTTVASFLWTACFFIGGLAGAYMLFRGNAWWSPQMMMIFFALAQVAAVVPLIVETRYRYSLYPFLALFAAHVFMQYKISRTALAVSFAFLLFWTGYDFVAHAGEIVGKIHIILSL